MSLAGSRILAQGFLSRNQRDASPSGVQLIAEEYNIHLPKIIKSNQIKSNRIELNRIDGDCYEQEARANDYTRANAMLQAGAHILSTDFPVLPTFFASKYAVRYPSIRPFTPPNEKIHSRAANLKMGSQKAREQIKFDIVN